MSELEWVLEQALALLLELFMAINLGTFHKA